MREDEVLPVGEDGVSLVIVFIAPLLSPALLLCSTPLPFSAPLLFSYAANQSTLMLAPDVVAGEGEVQPQTLFGYEPPMARSKMAKKPWSTAACQVAVSTWFSSME